MDSTDVDPDDSDQPKMVLDDDEPGMASEDDTKLDEANSQVLDVHAALGAEGGLLSWAAGGGVGGDIAILAQSPGDQSTAYGLQAQPQVLTGADQTQTDSSAVTQFLVQNGETIQVISIPTAQLRAMGGTGQLIQLVPAGVTGGTGDVGTILINQGDSSTGHENAAETVASADGLGGSTSSAGSAQVVDMVPVTSLGEGGVALTLMPPPAPPPQNLPPDCPQWAARLRDCEKIGDSYRGWVDSEVELDLLLTYHKQQTQSFWGTRQSPSPAKTSTRLMWKSQYVPFDGIPFVNSGSRAIVMECNFGPRRKGAQAKRQGQSSVARYEFKQTCPARIYIKKVKKFADYSVEVHLDKKQLKQAMDRMFGLLKERDLDEPGFGQERFYVQLPTESSHEFHNEMVAELAALEALPTTRLHPKIACKVRELVAAGETRLYAIRKYLRRYVEKELFGGTESVPEKHNLSYFPTVNDLQNHIHQAQKDIEKGVLPVTGATVNVDMMGGTQFGARRADGTPYAKMIIVTLTQNPGEDDHVISHVETQMSDGTTQISNSLTPETAQVLAKLDPTTYAGTNIRPGSGGSTGAAPVTIRTTATPKQPVMVDTASSPDQPAAPTPGAPLEEPPPPHMDLAGSEEEEAELGAEALLPTLQMDQADQTQPLAGDEMQMLSGADLAVDDAAQGIGVQMIGTDGIVRYVQQNIDPAQALQLVQQHDGVQLVAMGAVVNSDNMLPVTVDDDGHGLMKREGDSPGLLDIEGELSVDEASVGAS